MRTGNTVDTEEQRHDTAFTRQVEAVLLRLPKDDRQLVTTLLHEYQRLFSVIATCQRERNKLRIDYELQRKELMALRLLDTLRKQAAPE